MTEKELKAKEDNFFEDGKFIKNGTKFFKFAEKVDNKIRLDNVAFIYSDRIEKDMENIIAEGDINYLRIMYPYYTLDNLDFLKKYDLSFIHKIDIFSDIKNIDGIYSLPHIEEINSTNQKIDFSQFSQLRCLAGELSSFSYKTLHKLTSLERIALVNKFKEEDLTIFANNKKLNDLMVRGSKITSLKGIENFTELEKLSLYHNRKLQSLEGLTISNQKLKKITMDVTGSKLFCINEYLKPLVWLEHLDLAIKSFDSFEFLDDLQNLKFLNIHNKLSKAFDENEKPLLDALKRTNGTIW